MSKWIDAEKLRYEAELCIETTDAFQKLIDRQPEVRKDPVPALISNHMELLYNYIISCPICHAEWILRTELIGQKILANYCPMCGQIVTSERTFGK